MRERLSTLSRGELVGLAFLLVAALAGVALWYMRSLPRPVSIPFATRRPEDYKLDIKGLVQFGASPRATVFLAIASKAHAFIRGRGYVTPEDVKSIAFDVLRHRIILSYEAEAEDVTTEQIIQRVLDTIEVP